MKNAIAPGAQTERRGGWGYPRERGRGAGFAWRL